MIVARRLKASEESMEKTNQLEDIAANLDDISLDLDEIKDKMSEREVGAPKRWRSWRRSKTA